MTETEKLTRTKLLLNDTSVADDTVTAYLDVAKSRMLEVLYPYDTEKTSFPHKYDNLQCELASRMLMRRGFEGQTESNENGIIRKWDSTDDMDILNRITPFVGVL